MTQKLPIVKREMTKLGKSRDDIQDRLRLKIQDHRYKHGNRSRVGALLHMTEFHDQQSPDHIEKK